MAKNTMSAINAKSLPRFPASAERPRNSVMNAPENTPVIFINPYPSRNFFGLGHCQRKQDAEHPREQKPKTG